MCSTTQRYKPPSKTSLLWYCAAVQELCSTIHTTLQTAIKDVSFVVLYGCTAIVLHYTTLQTTIKDVSFVVLCSCTGTLLHYTYNVTNRHQRRIFCGIIRLYSNCAPLHNATNHHQRRLFCGIVQLYRNFAPLYIQRYKPPSKTSLLWYCTAVQELLSTIQTTLQTTIKDVSFVVLYSCTGIALHYTDNVTNRHQRRLFCVIIQLYRNCAPLYRQTEKERRWEAPSAPITLNELDPVLGLELLLVACLLNPFSPMWFVRIYSS